MENKDKKLPEEGTKPETLTSRVAKFSAIIYLVLAITVVIVATVGIFSISNGVESNPPTYTDPTVEIPSISVPDVDITPDFSAPPVIGEESGVDAELVPSEPEHTVFYYRPVTGKIQKQFSMDKLVFSQTMGDYRVHSGMDIACEIGTKVIAFTDGTVASVVDDYFYGTTVTITHADGVETVYKNLSSKLAEGISVGSKVIGGQAIGTVGDTARAEKSDEPHLHFEMKVNGELIDPLGELPE